MDGKGNMLLPVRYPEPAARQAAGEAMLLGQTPR